KLHRVYSLDRYSVVRHNLLPSGMKIGLYQCLLRQRTLLKSSVVIIPAFNKSLFFSRCVTFLVPSQKSSKLAFLHMLSCWFCEPLYTRRVHVREGVDKK